MYNKKKIHKISFLHKISSAFRVNYKKLQEAALSLFPPNLFNWNSEKLDKILMKIGKWN